MDELRLALYDDIAQVDEPVLKLSKSYQTKYWRGIDSDISFSLILKRKNGDIQLIVDQGLTTIGAGRNDIGLDESMLMTYLIKFNLNKSELLRYKKETDNLNSLVNDPEVVGLDDHEAKEIKQDWINTQNSLNDAMTSLMNQVISWVKANYNEYPVFA